MLARFGPPVLFITEVFDSITTCDPDQKSHNDYFFKSLVRSLDFIITLKLQPAAVMHGGSYVRRSYRVWLNRYNAHNVQRDRNRFQVSVAEKPTWICLHI